LAIFKNNNDLCLRHSLFLDVTQWHTVFSLLLPSPRDPAANAPLRRVGAV